MAHNGVEIELRFCIDESFAQDLEQRLIRAKTHNADFHEDTYFDPPVGPSIRMRSAPLWVSVRSRRTTSVNVKRFEFDADGFATHCRESELLVESADSAVRILEDIGFRQLIEVKKRRTEAFFSNFAVALDEVEKLGWFVEIEAVADFESVEAARASAALLARELGIDQFPSAPDGYPTMMLALEA